MEPQARIAFILVRCFAAAIAFYATERHPYSFYIFSRWVVFLTCCWGLFFYRPRYWQFVAPFYGIVGIIFNPFVPFHFTRGTWHDLDIAAGLILLATIPFTIQPENADKITRDSESVSESSLVEQQESEPFMNKNRIAKEWLYLLGGAIVGLVIVPLLGVCIHSLRVLVLEVDYGFKSQFSWSNYWGIYWDNAADFYTTLFHGKHPNGYSTDDCWIFQSRLVALAPYLLFQFFRSVIWAWKTAFPSSPPSVSNEKTKAQKERLKFWPILTVISLIGAGVVILASISSQTSNVSQKSVQSGVIPVDTNQSPQTNEASVLISNQNSNVTARKAIPVGTNPFDQFDSASQGRTAPAVATAPQSAGNIFDQFDTPSTVHPVAAPSGNPQQQSSNPYSRFGGGIAQLSVQSSDNATPAAQAQPVPSRKYFTIGSRMEEVAAIMGTPDSVEDWGSGLANWFYGGAKVTFRFGRVTGWINSSDRLKVKMNPSSRNDNSQ